MDGTTSFSLNPEEGGEEVISRGAEKIIVTRVDGSAIALDPRTTRITMMDEHAPLSQMGEDWGAVCEVFRQSVETFARVENFALQPGDEIALRYPGRAAEMVLRVIVLEGDRARVTLRTR